MEDYPSPRLVNFKDIGNEAFHELLRLFKSNIEHKTTIIKNFIRKLDLNPEIVPCYGHHLTWAYSYGRNGGGNYTDDNSIGYYYLANFRDSDEKRLLNEYNVHATKVYNLGEIADIYDVVLN